MPPWAQLQPWGSAFGDTPAPRRLFLFQPEGGTRQRVLGAAGAATGGAAGPAGRWVALPVFGG